MTRFGLATAALGATLAMAFAAAPGEARASEATAQQSCLYQLKRSGEQNTDFATVARSRRSGGAWDVELEDTVGMPWDCRARDDGTIEYLRRGVPGATGGGHGGGKDKDKNHGRDDDGGRWGEETRPARQACREAVRARSGRGGISIERVEFSQANTLVILRDDDEKGTWRCLSSNRGKVAELKFVRN
ncbi:hypothetical protein P2H44_14510 [Albimonas sp. CAU 1670]|uniref:hypothetical protein n=1 Tax=Albimonas sp. CAU 1670 TaxID=3032599 RepID=UPI0023D98569|nr:hypothetical protein [Albimonas sp. CAU 1670]MDF2233770.1 hypothetical protein [Albimonas sp. CAU 1670]